MMIAAIKLSEKPKMTKYTEKDILLDMDPTKTIDKIEMGEHLIREGYWSKRFVIYLVSSPDRNEVELKDQALIMKTLEKACPDLVKVFWFKKDEVLAVVYPFMDDENDASNFISIKSELIRVTQFFYLEEMKPDLIVEKVKKYADLLITIRKKKK